MPLPSAEDRAAGRAPAAFLVFLGGITSIVALTIDAILPALDAVARDLAFDDPNDRQLIVLVVFAGLGLGQPVFGPLSDAIGRRRAALIGWGIYGAGTLVAMAAPSLEVMLAGRFLQGLGAAGPRVVATAIVRDLYEGRAMARMISLIMTIFMLVPMLAPLLGQGLEALGGWRMVFVLYLTMAGIMATWHMSAVPETLANPRPLSFRPLVRAFAEVLTTPATMLYAVASMAAFGGFAAFLASAQQIYEETYALGPWFPLVFSAMAGLFAAAQFSNSRLVVRLGMRRLSRAGAALVIGGAALLLALAHGVTGPLPPLWLYLLCLAPVFIGTAWMFANLTALALEPMGHIAGVASSVVMSLTTLMGMPIGLVIASGLGPDDVLALFWGFLAFGALALALIQIAERVRP